MTSYEKYYHRMPDGTIKQINPFNGTEVWCVEERKRGPVINSAPKEPQAFEVKNPEDYCHFCEGSTFWCTPEKARMALSPSGEWRKVLRSAPDMLDEPWEFRRFGNLFEIVTFNYWEKNYDFKMSPSAQAWMEQYLSHPRGYKHAMNVLELKLNRIGQDFQGLSEEEKWQKLKPFFGGSHDLIVGRRHYRNGAQYAHELCSSGELTREEHYRYIRFTVDSLLELYEENPYIRYISVFQNWLRPAGASFDHLHRQLVGLDEWGVQIEREIVELSKNPNLYNEFAVNFAQTHSTVIAENDFAIATAEFGHRYPTLAVYSKSDKHWPFEQTEEEIRGMSDLVHALHTVLSSQTTCNEEWWYAPFDCIYSMPWHILIKLRLHNPAGFEGNTKIYINPVSPQALANEIIVQLCEKRDAGYIAPSIRVGEEVGKQFNVLQYYRGSMQRMSLI